MKNALLYSQQLLFWDVLTELVPFHKSVHMYWPILTQEAINYDVLYIYQTITLIIL